MTPAETAAPAGGPLKESAASAFVLLLLAGDVAFIILHFLLHITPMENPLYSLERDRGYSEFYQYLKEFWIIVLLLSIWARRGSAGYGAWALLFVYLLCDDAFRIHEELGVRLTARLDPAAFAGLRARDLGEFAVSAVSGAVLLVPLAWCYLRGSDAFRQSTRHLLVLVVALAFCGVFVDMLHMAVNLGREVRFLLGVLEDGGEMMAMSVIVGYVFVLTLGAGNLGVPLRNLVGATRTRSIRPRRAVKRTLINGPFYGRRPIV